MASAESACRPYNSRLMITYLQSAIVLATLPRWAVMWLVAFAIFAVCKLLTWSATPRAGVPVWKQLAYLAAWPGLNAARFFSRTPLPAAEQPTMWEWIGAAFRTVAGALIFWNADRWIGTSSTLVLAWAGMIGVILILHFGSFHLLSCFWRAMGVDARPLMNHPTWSTSVTEFWSNRWNTAFRDFTHQFVFRPLTRHWGLKAALMLGFVFSGTVHDVVISLPAGGGYGGPTFFFMIQALAILLQKSHAGRLIGLGRGWRGWIFTAIALLLPAPLLFHAPFRDDVVIPFMRALGAA
jgi:alginate O-acetyltransferase complex protein AlgI